MEETQDMLQGFILADQTIFQYPGVVDLHNRNYSFCEFRFRGLKPEIEKLRKYIEENNVGYTSEVDIFGVKPYKYLDVSDTVGEIRIAADIKTPELIEKFPALRATGIVESWSEGRAYPMLSESGFPVATKMGYGTYFDGNAECGDGRWDWEYDLLESVRTTWIDMDTGESVSISYQYPYQKEWDSDRYSLEVDGKIYIMPGNPESDFEIENGTLSGYTGVGGEVKIPDTVHTINKFSHAFGNNPSITSLYFPGTIDTIPKWVCEKCVNLKRVVIAEGVTRIDLGAFAGCSSLTELVLPESITHIAESAFRDCCNLDFAALTLPDHLQCAGQAFRGCRNVPELLLSKDKTVLLSAKISDSNGCLKIPDSVTTIGEGALCNDKWLRTVQFPGNLRHIEKAAFRDCENLVIDSLPDSLETIGEEAFYGCKEMRVAALPDAVKVIGSRAFSLPVNNIRLPSGLEKVPAEMFGYQSGRSPALEVIVSEGTKVIEANAFKECQDLISIQLPDSLECIEDSAFYMCKGLTQIVLPPNLRQLGNSPFWFCSNLAAFSLPESLEYIGDSAFIGMKTITEMKLPQGLKYLGLSAFADCVNLEKLDIPEGITELNNSLMRGCRSLRAVTFSDQIRRIGSKAFGDCIHLPQILIPESVEEIGDGAFMNCEGLKSIKLPAALKVLGKEAFMGCTGIQELTIPGTVSDIGIRMAKGCENLRKVRLESGVQKIAGQVFLGCPNLLEVEIPATVTKIGAKAFESCPKVTIVCDRGSAAEKYAKKNNLQISYVS